MQLLSVQFQSPALHDHQVARQDLFFYGPQFNSMACLQIENLSPPASSGFNSLSPNIHIQGLFSNRTGTSVDDCVRKSNNRLDQCQRGKLGTRSRFQSFLLAFLSSNDVPILLLNQPTLSRLISIHFLKDLLRTTDQRTIHFPLVIILSILTTFSHDYILTLLGEN